MTAPCPILVHTSRGSCGAPLAHPHSMYTYTQVLLQEETAIVRSSSRGRSGLLLSAGLSDHV